MKASIKHKLECALTHFEELEGLLATVEVVASPKRFSSTAKEYALLEPLVTTFKSYVAAEAELAQTEELRTDTDAEMRALAEAEITKIKTRLQHLSESLNEQLLRQDPQESLNVFLEIRAGTGGDEAGLFSGDLLRMYSRYAEAQGWHLEPLSIRPSEAGGYKEVICRITGDGVYSKLKFESGTHRVQRVPETESQGRVHTSACTVAVLPEPADLEAIEIDRKDMRIDTFRASGAGGQHVNKTDSAVRITHLPTGTTVECQEERSQHKNKTRAISLLQAKLMAAAQEQTAAEQAASRKKLVGSGDRSERIRTYNFPQGRVTDHRIGLTLHKIADILAGDLTLIIQPLQQEDQSNKMAAAPGTKL